MKPPVEIAWLIEANLEQAINAPIEADRKQGLFIAYGAAISLKLILAAPTDDPDGSGLETIPHIEQAPEPDSGPSQSVSAMSPAKKKLGPQKCPKCGTATNSKIHRAGCLGTAQRLNADDAYDFGRPPVGRSVNDDPAVVTWPDHTGAHPKTEVVRAHGYNITRCQTSDCPFIRVMPATTERRMDFFSPDKCDRCGELNNHPKHLAICRRGPQLKFPKDFPGALLV